MSVVVESRKSQTRAYKEVPTQIQELTFLSVDAKFHDSIKKMLAFFADVKTVKLGRISTVEYCIELAKDSRPFLATLYGAGIKT